MLELSCIMQVFLLLKATFTCIFNFTFSISCLSRFIKEHSKYDVIFPAPITVKALEIAHKFLFDSLFSY